MRRTDMKKILKKLFVLICTLSLLASMAVSVLADGTVIYDGNAKKFIFSPGSEYSPTDLFTDFKGIMPGESITQKVFIKNDIANNVKIKLYMRSLGANEGSEDLLSKLRLEVVQDGESKLFDAPAAEPAQLTDWVYLGTFYSGAEIDLDVKLDVPADLGNEYQGAIGYLDWEFRVEEMPIEPSDPKPPQTGDSTGRLMVPAAISGIVIIALAAYEIRRRYAKNNEI